MADWMDGLAAALGYSNPQKAIRDHVDEEDKRVNEMFTIGGKQSILIINESALYSLTFASKLPGAKKFKRWIMSRVTKRHPRYPILVVVPIVHTKD